MSPLIGITCRTAYDGESEQGSFGVREPYVDSIVSHGGVLMLTSAVPDSELYTGILSIFDGFLIAGGKDVSPSVYNEDPHEKLGKLDPKRDEVEMFVVRYARQHSVPPLGICRGCQVLNVACGGSLYQNLSAHDVRGGIVGE